MSSCIVGGRTEYFLSNRDGNPTITDQASVADPNALSCDLYEKWGADPWIQEAGSGRYPTDKDRVDPWLQLVAVGKTNISGYNVPIWYRTFLVVTANLERTNALQIVGGMQLFWWDTNQVLSESRWGLTTSSWLGIGVSGDALTAVTPIGQHFFDQHISSEGNIVVFTPADFPADLGGPADEIPDVLTEGGDIPLSPHQLIAVAKHDPWGWGLTQMRLFVQPANAQNPNRIGPYHLGLVGWVERVQDMNEQHDWVVTSRWGRSSTAVSHVLGIGQWWTSRWGWGPSIMELHFAPVTQLQWSGWNALPGGGTAEVGDAAVVYNNKLYLFGIGINDHGHYVTIFDGTNWSGWSALPGGGTANVGDAGVVYNNKLYLFGIGINDHGHYVTVFDGTNWSGWGAVPGEATTQLADTAVVYNNKLYLFGIGMGDRGHYVNVLDGTDWSGWSAVPGGGRTVSSDAAVVYNAKLYLFGVDNGIPMMNVLGASWSGWANVGSNWFGWTEVIDGVQYGVTLDAVCNAVVYEFNLYLFGIGLVSEVNRPTGSITGLRHYVNVFDGTSWSGWSELPYGGTSATPDGAAVYNEKVYLFSISNSDKQHYVNVLGR